MSGLAQLRRQVEDVAATARVMQKEGAVNGSVAAEILSLVRLQGGVLDRMVSDDRDDPGVNER